jgi:hypothetical protein
MQLDRPARANFRNESKADIKRPTIHVRFTPGSRHSWQWLECLLCANNGHSFRFALAIRQPALGLTEEHNFISPNDDRKRRSSGNKQSQ